MCFCRNIFCKLIIHVRICRKLLQHLIRGWIRGVWGLCDRHIQYRGNDLGITAVRNRIHQFVSRRNLGIGYQINEVQVGRAGKAAYNNLPAQMVADGLIQSNAYSLWLNDLDASTGSILFGGVDTAQYTARCRLSQSRRRKDTSLSFSSLLLEWQLATLSCVESSSGCSPRLRELAYLPSQCHHGSDLRASRRAI